MIATGSSNYIPVLYLEGRSQILQNQIESSRERNERTNGENRSIIKQNALSPVFSKFPSQKVVFFLVFLVFQWAGKTRGEGFH